MRHHAQALRRAGRFGDDQLVHLNKRELGYLTELWGEPSANPTTGLPEFFDLGGLVSWAAPLIIPAATEAIGGAGTLGGLGSLLGAGAEWASTVGGAGLGALTGGIAQGLRGKDWLAGALGGGAIGATVPSFGRALGFEGFQTPFNIPTLFDVGGLFGAGTGAAGTPFGLDAQGNAALSVPDPQGNGPIGGGAPESVFGSGTAAGDKGGWLARNPWAPMLALGALSALGSGTSPTTPPPQQTQQRSSYVFPTGRLNRGRNAKTQDKPGEYVFFDDNQTPDVPTTYAEGGMTDGPPSGGAEGYIQGPGDGREDMIPARLSNDEYVLDAETLALLGNGSPSAGADKMDVFRVNLRKHKGAALARGKFSPPAKSVEGYLGSAT